MTTSNIVSTRAFEAELPPTAIDVVLGGDVGYLVCENHAFESGRRHFIKMYRQCDGDMPACEFKFKRRHRCYTEAFNEGWRWQADNTHTL